MTSRDGFQFECGRNSYLLGPEDQWSKGRCDDMSNRKSKIVILVFLMGGFVLENTVWR